MSEPLVTVQNKALMTNFQKDLSMEMMGIASRNSFTKKSSERNIYRGKYIEYLRSHHPNMSSEAVAMSMKSIAGLEQQIINDR